MSHLPRTLGVRPLNNHTERIRGLRSIGNYAVSPRLRLMPLLLIGLLLGGLPNSSRAQADASQPTPEVSSLIAQALQAGKENKAAESIRLLNSALQKAHTQKDTAGEAYALAYLGIQNTTQLKHADAVPQLQKALSFFQKRHIKNMQIAVLAMLAEDCKELNQPGKTLDYAQQLIELSTEPEFTALKMEALQLKGSLYIDREQWALAVKSLEPTLAYLEQAEDKNKLAIVLGLLSFAYVENGDYLKAMQSSQKTLQMRQGVTNRVGEGLALSALACLYVDLGQYSQSSELAKRAIAVWRDLGQSKPLIAMQLVLGEAYRRQKQPQTALAYFNQALPLLRKEDDKDLLAGCLKFMGGAHRSMKQSAKALPCYEEAARLYHTLGDLESEGTILKYQGDVYLALGQKARARACFQQAVPILRRALTSAGVAGSHMEEMATLYYMADAEEGLGQLAQAKTHLAQAVDRAEFIRASVSSATDSKVGFYERILFGLQRNIALLMELKQPADAFAMVQKTKARALLDLMNGGKVNIRQSLTAEQATQEQALRQEADKLNEAMVREGVQNEVGAKKRFAALKAQLTQAERALQTYEDSLYAQHPELAGKRAATTVTLAQTAHFLPEDTALLEFVTLNAKEFPDMIGTDQTLLFVVTKQNGTPNLHVYPIAVPRDTLNQQVEAFRASCADPLKAYEAEARKLYNLLLRPALPTLEGKKRLLICPDGPLWGLPFAALHDGSQFLLQRYELAYAYSATGERAALQARERNKPQKTLLALGNPDFGGAERFGDEHTLPGQRPLPDPSRPLPDPSRPLPDPSRPLPDPSRALIPRGGRITMLPGTQREVDMLHQEMPDATILTGVDAQESAFKQAASGYRYVHIASHAFFNDAAPLLSSVVLAKPASGSQEDGYLTARELFDMNLQADMVVLSACNTARGEKRSGEGIIGLTWALFVAGAPTQVLSQWAVNDASTATLMGVFYHNLAQGKAAALRTAELSLLKDGQHAHPYHWAPFTLMGDWRR